MAAKDKLPKYDFVQRWEDGDESIVFEIPVSYWRGIGSGKTRMPMKLVGDLVESGEKVNMCYGKTGAKGNSHGQLDINVFFYKREDSIRSESKWTQVALEDCRLFHDDQDLHKDPIWTGKEDEWSGAGTNADRSKYAWRRYMVAVYEHGLEPEIVALLKKEVDPEQAIVAPGPGLLKDTK